MRRDAAELTPDTISDGRDAVLMGFNCLELGRDVAFFRCDSPSFCSGTVSFGRDVASFGRDVASFGRDVASFGRDVASVGRDVASFGGDAVALGLDEGSVGRDADALKLVAEAGPLTLIPGSESTGSCSTIEPSAWYSAWLKLKINVGVSNLMLAARGDDM